jgi:drug/metabolite transporter (DMT)-like permease
VAGVAVLTGPSGLGFGLHEGLVVLGAVAWAAQILMIDRYAPRHAAGPFTAAFFLFTGLLALAGLVATRGDATPGALLAALGRADLQLPVWGLALLSTLFTFLLLVRYQPRLDPSRAALLYVLEPAFAAVFAMLVHDEPFGGYKGLGCALLLAANVIVEARRR